MSAALKSVPKRSTTQPPSENSTPAEAAARQLTTDLERLRREEQARIDRERQEALARLQELARFD